MIRPLFLLSVISNLIVLFDFLSLIVNGQSLGVVLGNPDKPLFGMIVSYVLAVDLPAILMWSLCFTVFITLSVMIWKWDARKRRARA